MSKRKSIILHGYLKKLESRPIVVEADTVAEAVAAMCRQVPAFAPVVGKEKPRVRVKDFDTADSWYEDTDVEEIHLVPDYSGAKSGGFMQIIIGVALIGAAFISGGALSFAALGTFESALAVAGVVSILGGIVTLLSPVPTIDLGNRDQDPEASKYLGAPGNTVRIGTRIPIGYGTFPVYGHYLSFDINAADYVDGGSPADNDPSPNPFLEAFKNSDIALFSIFGTYFKSIITPIKQKFPLTT